MILSSFVIIHRPHFFSNVSAFFSEVWKQFVRIEIKLWLTVKPIMLPPIAPLTLIIENTVSIDRNKGDFKLSFRVNNWYSWELIQCACKQWAWCWQSKVGGILGSGGDSIVFYNIGDNSGSHPLPSWLSQLYLYRRRNSGPCCFWTHSFTCHHHYPQWHPTRLVWWVPSSL